MSRAVISAEYTADLCRENHLSGNGSVVSESWKRRATMANVIRSGKLRPPTSIPSVLSLFLSLSPAPSPSPNTLSLCPCNWEVHLLDRIDKCSTNKRLRSPRIHLSHVAWHGRQTNVGTGQTNRRTKGRADIQTETESMRAIQIDFVAVNGHSLSPSHSSTSCSWLSIYVIVFHGVKTTCKLLLQIPKQAKESGEKKRERES